MNNSFYRQFEDKYRGSRELIKSRLRVYLPFLDILRTLAPEPAAIDLGCGRGEWLELLCERGFNGKGVDLDEGMLGECLERGLHVVQADALTTLNELPDNSLTLVSAFHLVEHISFGDLQALASTALRKLIPGGLLILETPNPENLVVGSSNFYLDPTHVKPIPPQLLAFVTGHAGFQRHMVMRLQETPELRDVTRIDLFAVLDGVSPDYAVVAQKGSSAAISTLFDAEFDRNHGLTLPTLAARYDAARKADLQQVDTAIRADLQQVDTAIRADLLQIDAARKAELKQVDTARRAELQQIKDAARKGIGQLERQVDALRAQLADFDRQLLHANARVELLERHGAETNVLYQRSVEHLERAHRAETHARALEHQILAIRASTSWRVTAPLRLFGSIYRRLRGRPLSAPPVSPANSQAPAPAMPSSAPPPSPSPPPPAPPPLNELSEDTRLIMQQLEVRPQDQAKDCR